MKTNQTHSNDSEWMKYSKCQRQVAIALMVSFVALAFITGSIMMFAAKQGDMYSMVYNFVFMVLAVAGTRVMSVKFARHM